MWIAMGIGIVVSLVSLVLYGAMILAKREDEAIERLMGDDISHYKRHSAHD